MRILGNVEDQLNRLRSMQKTQDQTLVSLSQRSEALQKSEREAQDLRRQLEEARQALQREQAEWNQQRTLHESELNKRHSDLEQRSGEVSRKAAEFEKERQRLATLESDCQQRVQACEQQQRDIATRKAEYERLTQQMQAEHAELLKRVERAESKVSEMVQQVESSQQELALKTEQVTKAAQDAAAFRKRAAAVENALQQATARISQLEREAAELARTADTERKSIEAELEGVSEKLSATTKARNAAEKELAVLRERVEAAETKVKSLQSQLDERSAQLNESQRKLETAGKKLSEFAEVLSEQTPQLERGASAIAMVEELQAQIDRLTEELAEYKLRSDPEEMVRRDQRIEQLTEALRQARGQQVGQVAVAELEQRNAALTTEVDALKVELEKAQTAHQQLRQQLEERVDAQAMGVGQEAALAEHAAKIAALTAEIEQLHASAAADLKSKLDAQSKAHADELKKASGGDNSQVKSLRKRVKELENELEEARAAATSNESGGAMNEEQFSQKLREKAERITAVADHLRRRKTRLTKLRTLMATKTMQAENSPHTRGRTEEVLHLENERVRLSEIQHALMVTERAMIRKWARHRSAVAVAALFVVAILCAGAAWLIAGSIAPAEISASVALEARNNQRDPMPAEQAAAWRDWHIQVLQDPIFHQTVSKRMIERRIEHLTTPGALAQRLNGNLSIDAAQNGAITLTLTGTDGDETSTVLDVLASTLAMESNRQSDNRGDTSPAQVVGERREGGRARFSSINPIPISDIRLYIAGPAFAILLAGAVALIVFMYRRLSRAQSIFERDEAALMLE